MAIRKVDLLRIQEETTMSLTHSDGENMTAALHRNLKPGIVLKSNRDELTFGSRIPTLHMFLCWRSSDCDPDARNASAIRASYFTPARCAIYLAPNFDRGGNGEPDDVLKSIKRPAHIVSRVRSYLGDVFCSEKYAAVHWRYNKEDWVKSFCGPETIGLRSDRTLWHAICPVVSFITAQDVATAVYNGVLDFLRSSNQTLSEWRHTYIAAPPSMANFKKTFKQELLKLHPLLVSVRFDVQSYLNNNSASCNKNFDWSRSYEDGSMAEMEIMQQSTWLFYSVRSTWSAVAKKARNASENFFEASIFHLAKEAMLERTEQSTKYFKTLH